MRIRIGRYKNFFGPYDLAELIMFWVKKEPDEFGIPRAPDRVHNFGEWLAHGSVEPEAEVGEVRGFNRERHTTWLYGFLLWIDSFRRRRMDIHIDRWDTWSMDHTLGYIVLPMLKQLKETKHGAPFVDNNDVPKELRSDAIEGDIGVTHHLKWDWVIDEMIFAFETKGGSSEDWEDQFHTGEHDIQWKKLEGGHSQMIKGPNDTSKYDLKGAKAYQKRITNGFRLFGKYYENLWD